jgi:hypothetical protein
MNYTKPELCEGVAAVKVINGNNKTDTMHNDSITSVPPAFTSGAYEADE